MELKLRNGEKEAQGVGKTAQQVDTKGLRVEELQDRALQGPGESWRGALGKGWAGEPGRGLENISVVSILQQEALNSKNLKSTWYFKSQIPSFYSQ